MQNLRKIPVLVLAALLLLPNSVPAQSQFVGPGPIPPQALLPLPNIWLATQNMPGLVISPAGQAAQPFGNATPVLQTIGTTTTTASFGLGRWSADSASPGMRFFKSRGATIGSSTPVNSGDGLGNIQVIGDDGATSGGLIVAAIGFNATCTFSTGSGCGSINLQTRNTTGALTTHLTLNEVGDALWVGTIPVVTGTGTPTIVSGSTDIAGEATGGTLATSIIITFATTKSNAPFCVVTPQTQIAAFAYTISTSAITVTLTATTGEKVDYHCFQH